MEKITKAVRNLGIFSFGVVGHYYGSKLLDHKNELLAERLEMARDEKLNSIDNRLKNIEKFNANLANQGENINNNNNNQNLSEDTVNEFSKIVSEYEDGLKNVKNYLERKMDKDYTNNMEENINKIEDLGGKVKDLLDSVSKGKNNFINNFISNLDDLYKYLDTLTLPQVSALLHLSIFVVLLFTVLNILAILFGNEIIKYFNLESKFPSLAIFFNLRVKYQRYYLMWNVFLLFFFCIAGIAINILNFLIF